MIITQLQMERFAQARKMSIWSWVIIIAYGWFWANAHIYFIFGIGMIFSYWLACWWRMIMRRNSETINEKSDKTWLAGAKRLGEAWPRTETIGLLSLVGVSLINPNGWRGLLYPLGIFGNYAMAITENASPLSCWETVLNPMLLALPFLSIIALWIFWRTFRQHRNMTAGQLAGVLILLAALIATWCMARSAPLLALTILAPLGFCANNRRNELIPEECSRRSHDKKSMFPHFIKCEHIFWAGAFHSAGIIFIVALNLWLGFAIVSGSYSRIFPSPIGPTPFGFDDESRYLALRRLRADGLPGKIFSDYNSGSLVEYNLYPERGYVDNRPEAFPAAFWQKEYLPTLALGKVWNDTITQHGIQTVAVSTAGVKENFIRVLFTNPHWQLVHLDFFFAVFTLNTPENQDFLRRHAFGEKQIEEFAGITAQHIRALSGKKIWQRQILADQIVYELYGLICLSRNDLAWPLVWEMHLRYPDYQIVHELMRVSAPPRAWPAVMEVMNSRARWPLAAKQVLDYGAALEAQGRTNEAYRVYRRGKIFFPLCPNLPNRRMGT